MAVETAAGRMPPWKAGAADVSYLRDPTLTDAQKKIFADWVQHGMPEGDAKKPGAPLAAALRRPGARRRPGDDERAVHAVAARPTTTAASRSRGPRPTQKYIVGINATPGVPAQAHHIALYLVPPDSANLPFQWDAEDATPGYSCFGGPFGSRPQTFAVNLLTAWIPGTKGVMLPARRRHRGARRAPPW